MTARRLVMLLAVLSLVTPVLSPALATSKKPNPKLVAKYEAPPPAAADETLVYVIREGAFTGAARGVWIAHNDKVVTALDNSTHALIRIKSGINTVHAVQQLAGFAYCAVDNRPGETVFLALSYTTGRFEEVPRDLGITMVMKTKDARILDQTRPNTALEYGALNPGLLGFQMMEAGDAPLQPTNDSAVLTIFREPRLIKDVPFSLWSESGYVGDLKGATYLQVRLAPGPHTIIGRSEHNSVLKVDAVAGKQYFAEFAVVMGWNQAHVRILPLDAREDKKKIDGWLKKFSLVRINSAVLDGEHMKTRIPEGARVVGEVIKKVEAGEIETRNLKEDQGR